MAKSDAYTVSRGYVHYRKQKYYDEVGWEIKTDYGTPALPTQKINPEKIKNFLNKYAPLKELEQELKRNIDKDKAVKIQFASKLAQEVAEALSNSKAQLTGSIRKHVEITASGQGSHVTKARVDQLTNELNNLITLLSSALKELKEGDKGWSQLTEMEKKFEAYRETLINTYGNLKNSRSWSNKELEIDGKTRENYFKQMIKDMENIQQLYVIPSDEQYWKAVEKLVSTIGERIEDEKNRGVKDILSSVTSTHQGASTLHTEYAQLGIMLKSTKNTNRLEDFNKRAGKKSVLTRIEGSDSSAVISIGESQQTIDSLLEIQDPKLTKELGTSKLAASIKAYTSGKKKINVVSAVPLTSILEVSTDPTFLAHYANIISVPTHSDSFVGSFGAPRNAIKPYVKKLALLRGLVGMRGNKSTDNLSNVLFYTDGQNWEVYNSYEIASRSLEQLNNLVSLENYPDNGVRMAWVPSKTNPYAAAMERRTNLLADLHAIKLKVTLNLARV